MEDWIGEDHPVRVIDVFVDALDLSGAGLDRIAPAQVGRPGYHPPVLLKLFIYGYMHRVTSRRRLEKETVDNFLDSLRCLHKHRPLFDWCNVGFAPALHRQLGAAPKVWPEPDIPCVGK